MKHSDLLEIEYKEQYNQYRWIGHMQSYVLAFYGAAAAFASALLVASRALAPNSIDYRWPAGVMIGLGFLGILVGYGLFRSRTMQRRTARYLASICANMAKIAESDSSLCGSAIRFRNLCRTKGRFKMWDTMNISILIALYSGEVFILVGLLIMSAVMQWLCLSQVVMIGLPVFLVFVVCTPVLVQKMMDRERKRMETEYDDLQKINDPKDFLENIVKP